MSAQSFEIVQTKNCAQEDIFYYIFSEKLDISFLKYISEMGEIIYPFVSLKSFFKIDRLEYQVTGNIGRRDVCLRIRHLAEDETHKRFEHLFENYCSFHNEYLLGKDKNPE